MVITFEGRIMSLRVENLSYIYQAGTAMESYALRDISFETREGEFIGLIGHTGSGKSTLIQHLNGLIKPTEGHIFYNDRDIYSEGMSLKELRQKVGLVFQYPEYQLFETDVITDVKFGPKNMGLSDSEAEEAAKRALELSGIGEEFYKRSPFELSGGQKRRVAIAGVLAMDPEVLILDEPAAGLDPLGKNEILSTIERLHHERKNTIIMVSHSMEDVAEYADRIMVLDSGRLVYFDEPKVVFRHYEELEKMGLSAPQITYLMGDLKKRGFDVDDSIGTVEAAKAEILMLWKGKQKYNKE